MPKPAPLTVVTGKITDCACVRAGYALLLCQNHAPIPFELTDRGRRAAHHMTKWDAIEGVVESGNRERARRNREALAAGRRIEARVRKTSAAKTP
jgi:hypothetical protein